MGGYPRDAMQTIRLRSPSKINLHLRVAGPDASGFHPLRSWFVTTDLCDGLAATVAPAAARRVTLRCDDPTLPTDGRNLVVRAAEAFLAALPTSARPFAVELDLAKRIPAGAGLGGGSSNAAATLRALAELLSPYVSGRPALEPIAARLGSDVPFFLGAPSAVATGRGEQLVAAPAPRADVALLIFPPFGIPTPAAYRKLDEIRPAADTGTLDAFDVDEWATLGAAELSRRLVNDLEPAAFALEPRLSALRDDAERTIGRPVRMSGSGSTLFALFDDEAEAAAARADFGDAVRSQVVRLGAATVGPALSPPIF